MNDQERTRTSCPAASRTCWSTAVSGIAVGMATNIPPHNLREIVNGMVALMDDPEIDLAGLMEYVKGPDFPTGGIIMGRSGIRAAYATGRGKITLRGRAEIVEKKNGRYANPNQRNSLHGQQDPPHRVYCGPCEG